MDCKVGIPKKKECANQHTPCYVWKVLLMII